MCDPLRYGWEGDVRRFSGVRCLGVLFLLWHLVSLGGFCWDLLGHCWILFGIVVWGVLMLVYDFFIVWLFWVLVFVM